MITEIAAGLSPHTTLARIKLPGNFLRNILRALTGQSLDNNLRMGFKLEYRLTACWLISYRTV
ncbi:hypothetical protein MJ580_08800 [Klebsiella pneumoniae]|nr:hypothetical protein MJ580_08800 [Klebsiella pneumoniae]